MAAFHVAPHRPQATVSIPPFHTWSFADGTTWTQFYRADGGYLVRFPRLADFEVSADADGVTCFPTPEASEATVEHLFLNQVLPLIESRRGKLVFHASAVEVGAVAIAFVAESGRGKSTLAAAFAAAGYRLLTDDGLVVETGEHGFEILPSHPSIRLWDDSREALLPPSVAQAPALDFTTKARVLAGDSLPFCAAARPLLHAYFLGDGSADRITIAPMHQVDALVAWIGHSFLLDIEEKTRLASHFTQVAVLAKQAIHYRLDYPRKFDHLAELRQTILEHACHATDAV